MASPGRVRVLVDVYTCMHECCGKGSCNTVTYSTGGLPEPDDCVSEYRCSVCGTRAIVVNSHDVPPASGGPACVIPEGHHWSFEGHHWGG